MISTDGRLLFATCGVRTFAYGFMSVVLGLYLSNLGFRADTIGIVFTVALAGGAVMTVVFTALADRVGRRRVLIVGATLMGLAGLAYALSTSLAVFIGAALVGTISPSGKEVGPFLSIEQAILPQTSGDENRTSLFAHYNLVGSLSGALGALAAGLPTLLGVGAVVGERSIMLSYVAAAVVLIVLFTRLSPAVEPRLAKSVDRPRRLGLHRSRAIVAKLAALFAIDAFAGAFVVQGLIAYWFHLRYGLDVTALGAIFFGTNLFSALSFLAAAPIARRIGLLNTMVFTHLPSNVLLALVPLMPTLLLAAIVLLARNLLSQLDVPTRQSYTMAVVAPDERAAAAGLTSVARNAAAAVAPAFAGATLAVPALGLPFLIAGGIKIAYDLAILATFRSIRPPEEADRAPSQLPPVRK